ncbi:MAG TPA: hypothetical protein VG870_01910 [Chitinophagaceae bacterium]|nr:hypothetical protein [Chitinophagaceae bacterium]
MQQAHLKAVLCFVVLLGLNRPGDAQGSTWQVVHTRNQAINCSECGMAAVDGKLYLLGGDDASPRPVQRYDPATNAWTVLAMAPIPMHHFQAVAWHRKIYVLDAFSGGQFPVQDNMPNVYSYDTRTNRWQKEGEVPAARRRAGAAAVEYHGKLYLVDGIQHGHSSGTTNMFDCYDPVSRQWTVLPDAPHIRDHCFAAVIGDRLYVVGGRNTSFRDPQNKIPFFAKTMLDVDVFDFATSRWSTLPARLPLGSGGGALVALNGVLYYMGGERATDTEPNAPRKNVFSLDPLRGSTWQELDSLREARNGMCAAVIGHTIYAAGGSGGGAGRMPPPNPGGQPATGNPNPQPRPQLPSGPPRNQQPLVLEKLVL